MNITTITTMNNTHFPGILCEDTNGSGNNNGSQVLTPLQKFQIGYGAVHGYLSMCVCLFGMLANLANIIVLTRKNMKSSTNIILTWLAVADLLTMIDYFPFVLHFYILKDPSLQFPFTYGYGWVIFLAFHASFSIVCHTIAIWLTIELAIFRFIYIWFPTKGGIYCNQAKAKKAVLCAIIYTITICVPNYLSNTIVDVSCLSGKPLKSTAYTLDERHEGPLKVIGKVNYWIQAFLVKLIPCFMLTILTLLLIVAMHRAHKRRMALKNQGRKAESDKHGEHNRTTFMLLTVVVLFLITEMPQGIFTIMVSSVEGFQAQYYEPLGDLFDVVALCNNSVNFVLYCSMSTQFRKTFFDTFCSCIEERKKGWRKLGVVTAQKNGCSNSSNLTVLSSTTKV